MLLNPDVPWEEYNYCSTGYVTIQRFCHRKNGSLVRSSHAVVCYWDDISGHGVNARHISASTFSLSISLTCSLALCGWWRWCESRQMGLAARQQAVVLCVCCRALFPRSHVSHVPHSPPLLHITLFSLYFRLHPFLTNIACPIYVFCTFYPNFH